MAIYADGDMSDEVQPYGVQPYGDLTAAVVKSDPLGFLDSGVSHEYAVIDGMTEGYDSAFDGARLAADRPAGVWERRIVRRVIEEERDVLALRVSAVSGCLRKAHYDASGYEKADEPSPEGWAMRTMGVVLEPVMVQRLLREESVTADGRGERLWRMEDTQRDTRCLIGDVELQGTIDAIASHPNYANGSPFVLEVKTRRHAQKEFARVAGVERNSMGGRPAENAHRAAAMQAAVYSMCEVNADRSKARGVMVATFSRDDASVTLNYIPASRALDLWDEALMRIETLKASLKSGTPPPPEYQAGHKICSECEFRSMCGNHIADSVDAGEGDILSDEELSKCLVLRLNGDYNNSAESKGQGKEASDRIKRHMIALDIKRLEIPYNRRLYGFTLSEIEKRGLNYERVNELLSPEERERCDEVEVHYRLNMYPVKRSRSAA